MSQAILSTLGAAEEVDMGDLEYIEGKVVSGDYFQVSGDINAINDTIEFIVPDTKTAFMITAKIVLNGHSNPATRPRSGNSIQKNKGQPQSKQTHHNLAQVNFTIVDHFNNSSHRRAKAYAALVSWAYWGTPSDPKEKWQDWDGFTVTRYTKQQRNV